MNDAQLPARLHFNDSVRLRIGPDRGFLFDQKTGRVYSVNASGALAAARIQAGDPSRAVIAAVTQEFDVDQTAAERDFTRFVTQLIDEGLGEADG